MVYVLLVSEPDTVLYTVYVHKSRTKRFVMHHAEVVPGSNSGTSHSDPKIVSKINCIKHQDYFWQSVRVTVRKVEIKTGTSYWCLKIIFNQHFYCHYLRYSIPPIPAKATVYHPAVTNIFFN